MQNQRTTSSSRTQELKQVSSSRKDGQAGIRPQHSDRQNSSHWATYVHVGWVNTNRRGGGGWQGAWWGMPPCRLEFSKCSAASNTLHASERVLSRACSGQRAAALHRLAVPRARRRPLARLYRGGGGGTGVPREAGDSCYGASWQGCYGASWQGRRAARKRESNLCAMLGWACMNVHAKFVKEASQAWAVSALNACVHPACAIHSPRACTPRTREPRTHGPPRRSRARVLSPPCAVQAVWYVCGRGAIRRGARAGGGAAWPGKLGSQGVYTWTHRGGCRWGFVCARMQEERA